MVVSPLITVKREWVVILNEAKGIPDLDHPHAHSPDRTPLDPRPSLSVTNRFALSTLQRTIAPQCLP
jgi:hypothetical protein